MLLLFFAAGEVSLVVHFLEFVRIKLDWWISSCKGATYFLRLLSETIHSTSSSRQFVQGAPCSTTLHRTLRERQHWQAFDALLLTLLGGRMPLDLRPASEAVRFEFWEWTCIVSAGGDDDESERLQSIGSMVGDEQWRCNPVQGIFSVYLDSSLVIPGIGREEERSK